MATLVHIPDLPAEPSLRVAPLHLGKRLLPLSCTFLDQAAFRHQRSGNEPGCRQRHHARLEIRDVEIVHRQEGKAKNHPDLDESQRGRDAFDAGHEGNPDDREEEEVEVWKATVLPKAYRHDEQQRRRDELRCAGRGHLQA